MITRNFFDDPAATPGDMPVAAMRAQARAGYKKPEAIKMPWQTASQRYTQAPPSPQVMAPQIEALDLSNVPSDTQTADLMKQVQGLIQGQADSDESEAKKQRDAEYEKLRTENVENQKKLDELRKNASASGSTNSGTASGDGKVSGASPGGTPLSAAANTSGDYLDKTAAIESGGRWDAVGALGTLGRYQFMPSTLQGIIARYPHLGINQAEFLKSPDMQRKAMAALTEENKAKLQSSIGRPPSNGELYLGHFLGAGGASKLLSNPDRPLVEIVGQAVIDANRWLAKFGTGRQLLDETNRSFG